MLFRLMLLLVTAVERHSLIVTPLILASIVTSVVSFYQQVNKRTMSHLCRLKAQLAKLRTELLEGPKQASQGTHEGFEVSRTGAARIALIGFPSVGKSTLLSTLTGTKSEQAAYEFTTLTC